MTPRAAGVLLHISPPIAHVCSVEADVSPHRTYEDIMTKFILLAITAAALAAPALAGDPAAGEDAFKKCKACHSVIAPDGTEIQKGGRTGPNLYGIIGRAIASDPDHGYGESLATLGATGAVWDQASFAAYVSNPAEYLKTALGDDRAKSRMSFKLASGAEDIAAYLVSVSQ
jgi:cytochrome c